MALNNIHVEHEGMTTAVSKASEVQSAIIDYERQLTNIAEMVKSMWHGQAKVRFGEKHEEIVRYININAQDAGSISEGTNQALNISVTADEESAAIIGAIQAQH